MKEFKQLTESLKPFVKKVCDKQADKALRSLCRELATALYESGISPERYLEAYHKDTIFDPSCLLGNHINLFDFVQPEFVPLCKVMFEQRPVGLGTPNAMVGEGEFMALYTSPRVKLSKVKDTGDITVDGKAVELKGTELRFYSPMKITGKQVQTHAQTLAKKYEVMPNICKDNRTAFEPWDHGNSKTLNKVSHWIQQFKKLGTEKSKQYLYELSGCFMECREEDFDVCFDKGVFDVVKYQQLIVSKWFKGMEKNWDAFTQINESKIVSISDNQKDFDKLISTGKLKIYGNYFRSFQDIPVGLYATLS